MHICKPTDERLYGTIKPAVLVGEAESAISNIQLGFPIILAAAGITFLLAIAFTGLLEFLTSCVTWVFLVVYIAFTSFLGLVFFCAFF